jgi:hypothetical protein
VVQVVARTGIQLTRLQVQELQGKVTTVVKDLRLQVINTRLVVVVVPVL